MSALVRYLRLKMDIMDLFHRSSTKLFGAKNEKGTRTFLRPVLLRHLKKDQMLQNMKNIFKNFSMFTKIQCL